MYFGEKRFITPVPSGLPYLCFDKENLNISTSMYGFVSLGRTKVVIVKAG